MKPLALFTLLHCHSILHKNQFTTVTVVGQDGAVVGIRYPEDELYVMWWLLSFFLESVVVDKPSSSSIVTRSQKGGELC